MKTVQEAANEIGALMRELEGTAEAEGATATLEKARALHSLLSQGCVDHLPDVDWYEAAGFGTPAKGDMAVMGGGTPKTKPEPSSN